MIKAISFLLLKFAKSWVYHRAEFSMMMSFRSQLLSFSSRLSPKVQGKKDLIEIQEIIKDEVEDLMNELKDYDPDVFYAESDDVILSDEPLDGELVD